MKKSIFLISNWGLGLLCCVVFHACSDKPNDQVITPEEPTEKQYAVYTSVGNSTSGTTFYTLTTNDLMKDTVISPVKSGLSPDEINFWSAIYSAVSDGNFYYTLDGNAISKQRIENGRYIEIGNLVTNNDTWSLGMMKTVFNDNGLNFLSWAVRPNIQENVIEKDLYIVDTANNMSVKSITPIKIPVQTYDSYDDEGNMVVKTEVPITPSSFSIHDGKLFMGYLYGWDLRTQNDTTYMLICDYPSLANSKVLKDARLGHVSGTWYASSSSFLDEKGDYYFTTVNRDRTKFGVLRIKKGETEIDPNYSFDFDVSAYESSIFDDDHHAYLKNGQVLMGCLIIDIYNKSIIKDLNSMSLGKVQFTMDTYTEENNPYVVLKTDDSRWFVAKYDINNATLTRGIEIDGGIEAVSRLARIK